MAALFSSSSLVGVAPLLVALAATSCARGSEGAGAAGTFTLADAGSPHAIAAGPDAASTATSALADPAPTTSAPTSADDAGDGADTDAGMAPATDDADTDDAGDAAATPAPPLATVPAPGDLVITEIMLSPSGEEPETEWFEIYNASGTPKRLNDLVLEDGYFDTEVISLRTILAVQPGAYAVLVRDRAAALQAGVPAGAIRYAYGAGLPDDEGIELDAADSGELSLWKGDTLLADVPYGQWDATYPGRSIELAGPSKAEDVATNWCLAPAPWAPGSDDGTPGAASDCGF